jgi:3-carboxy-cis,cis-muconate cycloisomerase
VSQVDGQLGSGALFGMVTTTDALARATSDESWLQAMLDFEMALARAEARAGVIPGEAGSAIERCCKGLRLDPVELGRAGRLSGNPAVALVGAIRHALPEGAERWAHFGATSQDTVDTALMLVARDVIGIVAGDLARAAKAAARLSKAYRSTPIAGRTLLQQAAPTTFGRKASGWLLSFLEAGRALRLAGKEQVALQLGGPVGTLAELGGRAGPVASDVAGQLGLPLPVLPWHENRLRIAEISSALVLGAAASAKVALDVALLMQSEVGEAFEAGAPGRGVSSSMPHKRNPALSVEARAAWQQALGLYTAVLGSLVGEHERGAGSWQGVPEVFSQLCRAAGGAVAIAAEIVEGLEVDPERMARNLELLPAAPKASQWLAAAEAMVDEVLAEYKRETGTGA